MLFFWPGILQDAHAGARTGADEESDDIPYGVIFATFMAAMILGAMLFNTLVQDQSGVSTPDQQVTTRMLVRASNLMEPNILLGLAILLASVALLLAVFVSSESGALLSFLGFEICNGFYVPSIALQRGKIINESNRAWLYGLMKLPLFIFVIVALCTDINGPNHRQRVFMPCFVKLAAAALASLYGLRNDMEFRGQLLTDLDPEGDLQVINATTKIDQKVSASEDAGSEN